MMKKLMLTGLLTALFASSAFSDEVLVGFHEFDDPGSNPGVGAAQLVAPGFTGSIDYNYGLVEPQWNEIASADGTYGSLAGAPIDQWNTVHNLWTDVFGAHASLDLTISNGSATDYVLDYFRFDMWNNYADSPRFWTLTTTDIAGWGDISGEPGVWKDDFPAFGGANDYYDTDIDLSTGATEAARTLAAGDSVTFTLVLADWDGASGTFDSTRTFLDNIAVSGTAIPEPATLSLLGMASIGLLAFRRRVL